MSDIKLPHSDKARPLSPEMKESMKKLEEEAGKRRHTGGRLPDWPFGAKKPPR